MNRSRLLICKKLTFTLLLILLPATTSAQTISSMVPAAIVPGKTTEVTIYGSDLTNASQLWTSFPATVKLAPNIKKNRKLPGRVTYLITTKANIQVGIGAIRLATNKGISSLKLIMIDDLATNRDNTKNHSQQTAQSITTAIAIDGQVDSLKTDFYQFTATEGQRLTIDVLAARLGSQLDPVIRLLDDQGRELTYSDDEPGVATDARLVYRFQKKGNYYLTIRDIRHRGGSSYRYRMRVGYFPLATVAYPLGGKSGSTIEVRAIGKSLDPLVAKKITIPSDRFDGAILLSFKYLGGKGSGFVTLQISQQNQWLESEPNDTAKTATKVALPATINARFEKPKDRDYFQFSATKGRRFLFVGKTRSLGSPSALSMEIRDAKGNLVAAAEDTGKDEGILDFKAPTAGSYRLMASDLLHRGGAAHAYCIEVQPFRSRFSLSVDVDRVVAPQNGSFTLKVTAVRKDYKGPIQLLVAGAGGGFKTSNDVIAVGKNSIQMKIEVDKKFVPSKIYHINILGTGKDGVLTLISTASTKTALKKLMPNTPYPPAMLDGMIGLGIVEK